MNISLLFSINAIGITGRAVYRQMDLKDSTVST